MPTLVKMSLISSLLLYTCYAQDNKDLNATEVTKNQSEGENLTQDFSELHSVKKIISSFGNLLVKEVLVVDAFDKMFTDGKATAQLRTMYAAYNNHELLSPNTYATAAGGQLRYELASYNGFNAAFAGTTVEDMRFASGDIDKGTRNNELASSRGKYSLLGEMYLNYHYEGLNLRAGRQIIDTPLADSDDIRMVPNSFEAYIASYNYEKFSLMLGNLQQWQGVDAGLNSDWIKTGDNGTWLVNLNYSGTISIDAWFYHIDAFMNASYLELGFEYQINDDFMFATNLQYLNEEELSNSATAANIFGGLFEIVYSSIGSSIAYTHASRIEGKQSFSGFGGGAIFTNMDTMIIDNITLDRDVDVMLGSIFYQYADAIFLYAYGDFSGGANGQGQKEHIIEHDIGFEYTLSDRFVMAATYIIEEDKQSILKTANDWERTQIMMKYDF